MTGLIPLSRENPVNGIRFEFGFVSHETGSEKYKVSQSSRRKTTTHNRGALTLPTVLLGRRASWPLVADPFDEQVEIAV